MLKRIMRPRLLIGAALLAASIAAAGFVTFVNATRVETELPVTIGNWPRVQEQVPVPAPGEPFSFAAAGDMRADETFDAIVSHLRTEPLAFLVLLGDVTRDSTEADHRFLRAKMARQWKLPFPVFYLPGNHDLDPDGYPLDRFEATYGRARFAFTRGANRFIFLTVLPEPYGNETSLQFLEKELRAAKERGERAFVFGHCSPRVTPFIRRRTFSGEERLCSLLETHGATAYLGGDFHGYCRTTRGPTTYLVTGGGGAHLARRGAFAFHHAMVVTLSGAAVVERVCVVTKKTRLTDRLTYLSLQALTRFGWPLTVAPFLACAVLAGVLLACGRRTP
jgi:hypothetical protein